MGIATLSTTFRSVAMRCGHFGCLVYCPGVSTAGHPPRSAWCVCRKWAWESRNSVLAQAPCRTHSRTSAICHECSDRVRP